MDELEGKADDDIGVCAAHEPRRGETPPHRGDIPPRRRALVVEPPGPRRLAVRLALRGAGFQVDEAPDESAALRLLRTRGPRYAAVVMDERPGYVEARERVIAFARAIRAQMPVVACDLRALALWSPALLLASGSTAGIDVV